MCGAVLGQGNLSGCALAIGGVFGRIAGQQVAALAGRAAALAEMRAEEYRGGLLPRGTSTRWLAGVCALCLFGLPLAALPIVPGVALIGAQAGPGSFYAVIPHQVIAAGAGLAFGAAGLVVGHPDPADRRAGLLRVWPATGAGAGHRAGRADRRSPSQSAAMTGFPARTPVRQR